MSNRFLRTSRHRRSARANARFKLGRQVKALRKRNQTSSSSIVTYLSESFESVPEGYARFAAGWSNNTTNLVYLTTAANRAWDCESGTTPSVSTGPYDGHMTFDPTGGFGTGSRYFYTEASSQFNKRFLLRSPAIDFSNSLANNTLELSFWFHMYGTGTGSLAVGVTTSSTSADRAYEVVPFTGIKTDIAGGLVMDYWTSYDGSTITTSDRITGQQQTTGHTNTTTSSYWRKATVDLNAFAGQTTPVYFWFFAKTGSSYTSDIAIDDIKIVGEE